MAPPTSAGSLSTVMVGAASAQPVGAMEGVTIAHVPPVSSPHISHTWPWERRSGDVLKSRRGSHHPGLADVRPDVSLAFVAMKVKLGKQAGVSEGVFTVQALPASDLAPFTVSGPSDEPRVGTEPEAAMADSADRSAAFPTCIDLTVDEPFFSDDLLQSPPATVSVNTVALTPSVFPPATGPAELDVLSVSRASLQHALVSIPAVRPAVPRLTGSHATGSSSALARSLVGPGSEAQDELAEAEDLTWTNSLSHIASVGLRLQAMAESIVDEVVPGGQVPFGTCCSPADVLSSR